MSKFVAGLLAAFFAAHASAALLGTTYSILPATITAHPGDVGDSFDVVLTNNGTSSLSVAAFAFEISVSSSAVTLTGANFSTGATPYIFPLSDSFDALESLPLNINSGQTLDGSDLTNDDTGITVSPGEAVALADILFNVASNASAGPVSITFTGVPSGGVVADSNNLSDPVGDLISVNTFLPGSISVSAQNNSTGPTVPEPSTAVLVGSVVLMGVVFLDRRMFS